MKLSRLKLVAPRYRPVFAPFEVVIEAGEEKVIDLKKGKLVFNWSGSDTWTLYRGDQQVDSYSGKGQQALQAGTYTIKPRYKPVFAPFEVVIKEGETLAINK